MIFFVKPNSSVDECVDVGLGKLHGLCVLGTGGWGCANLRALIMTPYYSLQELPSFARHITRMA